MPELKTVIGVRLKDKTKRKTMIINIDNKHELGENVGFFVTTALPNDNKSTNKPCQEFETRECIGTIEKITIEITKGGINHYYEVKDTGSKFSFKRDDNTLLT